MGSRYPTKGAVLWVVRPIQKHCMWLLLTPQHKNQKRHQTNQKRHQKRCT